MTRDPLVTHIYTADPSAHVFEGRIYVYPSHDLDIEVEENDLGDPSKGVGAWRLRRMRSHLTRRTQESRFWLTCPARGVGLCGSITYADREAEDGA